MTAKLKRREFITLLGGAARLCFWEDQVESGLVAGINRPAGISRWVSLLAEDDLRRQACQGCP
jgi:hypothetical protein